MTFFEFINTKNITYDENTSNKFPFYLTFKIQI